MISSCEWVALPLQLRHTLDFHGKILELDSFIRPILTLLDQNSHRTKWVALPLQLRNTLDFYGKILELDSFIRPILTPLDQNSHRTKWVALPLQLRNTLDFHGKILELDSFIRPILTLLDQNSHRTKWVGFPLQLRNTLDFHGKILELDSFIRPILTLLDQNSHRTKWVGFPLQLRNTLDFHGKILELDSFIRPKLTLLDQNSHRTKWVVKIHVIKWTPAHCEQAVPARADSAHATPAQSPPKIRSRPDSPGRSQCVPNNAVSQFWSCRTVTWRRACVEQFTAVAVHRPDFSPLSRNSKRQRPSTSLETAGEELMDANTKDEKMGDITHGELMAGLSGLLEQKISKLATTRSGERLKTARYGKS
ncbi:hypothetical protein J6590_014625 [Homalodisca vitripennis]|nr:hypothetical protein J6590_014625 [Homalodisca vitripennis]